MIYFKLYTLLVLVYSELGCYFTAQKSGLLSYFFIRSFNVTTHCKMISYLKVLFTLKNLQNTNVHKLNRISRTEFIVFFVVAFVKLFYIPYNISLLCMASTVFTRFFWLVKVPVRLINVSVHISFRIFQ